jgi:hypothetical protein
MPNNYGTGPVPQNWSGQDRKFADSLKENVDVICGHRGDPLDRAVTARDLLDSGLATLPAGANFYSGFSNGLDPIPYLIPNLLIPPIVTNLTATGGFSVILLGWDMPLYLGHAFYEIWRNTSDSISSSTLLATTTQMTGLYSDYAGSAQTYYYWVRAVNSNGIAGPFNSSIGTSATTQPDVALILDLLEDEITSSQLASDLATPIANLPSNTSSVIAGMQSQINTLSITAAWAAGAAYIVTDLATFNGNLYEVLVAHTSTVANQPSGTTANNTNWKFVGAFTSLASAVGDNTAGISDINYLNSSSNSAAAVRISSLTADVATQASGLSAAVTVSTQLGGRVTATETSITAQAVDITDLETTVNNQTTGVSATSTAVGGLATRVTAAEGSITTQSSDITALETTVNHSTTGVAATSTAVGGLSTRVTAAEGSITAQSSDISALETTVNNAATGVSATSTALGGLTTRVTAAEGSIVSTAGSLTQLNTTVGQNSSAITNESTARTAADSALSTSISTLSSTVGVHTTSIQTNATSVDGLSGQYSVKIDSNGHVAGFGLSNTTVNSTPSSAFIVRADKFAIINPASTSNGLGTTSPSAASVPFTVTSATTLNGVAVPAGVYMKSAYIQNGSIVNAMIGNAAITDAKISTLSATKITTGTLDASSVAIIGVAPNLSLKSASSGERMEILAGKINVFDANGILRVKLGNLA